VRARTRRRITKERKEKANVSYICD